METTQALEKLRELTKHTRTCMFTTLDAGGILRGRPMATQEITPAGEVLFLTSQRSAHDFLASTSAILAYLADSHSTYVSISGKPEVRTDRATVHRLWSPFYRAWWPNGPDDDDIRVLAVRIERAEYWDSPKGKLIQLLQLATAAITRNPAIGEGEHGIVSLGEPQSTSR